MSGPGTGGLDRSRWLPAGTRLNDLYEIEEGIAAGGMGEIYRGRAIETGDLVAIKTIRWDVADSEAALGMFRREASALHNLYHEAIVRYYVFSVDRTLNRPYLAMEFVSGPSLSDMLKDGPLDYDSVRILGARVAAGLQAAHERGIIHRDMSPDNIILPDGDVSRAKIIDFGIARQTKQSEGTIIGDGFAGKYNYVSPEQLGMHGGEVTGASDIYSLGLVLAEAIAGRAINMRGNPVEVIQKRQQVPDISHLDARIRLLIARMLQSEPGQRPQSMREVAAWLRRGSGTTPPQRDSYGDADHEGTVVSFSPRPTLAPGTWPPNAPQAATQAPEPAARSRTPVYVAAAVAIVAALGGAGAWLALSPGEKGGGREEAAVTQPADRRAAEAPPQVAAGPNRAIPVDRPAASAVDIVSYLDRLPASGCLFVAPVVVGDGRLVAEGFARDPGDLDRLGRRIAADLGVSPDLRLRHVSGAQCPVVDMLAAAGSSGSEAPKLEVVSNDLRPGDTAMGEAAAAPRAYLGVARVTSDGTAEVLAPAAQAADGFVPFEAEIAGSGAELIVAFSSQKAISALGGQGSMPASDFVERIAAASAGGGRVASAARYVEVGR